MVVLPCQNQPDVLTEGSTCSLSLATLLTEIQKDKNHKGKLLCLCFFAHHLRNAEHHLKAAKTQAVSLQKELAHTWQDTQPAFEDKTLATAYVKSFWACVDKVRGLHDPPSGSTCPRKT